MIGVMVGVKVRKKLQFNISMTEPQSNLPHAYKKKNMYACNFFCYLLQMNYMIAIE